MSVQYQAIGWNRQKKIYDAVMVGGIGLYLLLFLMLGVRLHPYITVETLLIRALGTCAFLLLHVVLCIGPLCRLSSTFLPFLYNRRHLGVTTFLLGLGHGLFALIQFHALGNIHPLVSLFVSNPQYGSLPDFPFQSLGFLALVILYVMAATSHDFWLHNLSPRIWKRLHMAVYVAYALLVAHVALGALQSEPNTPLLAVLLFGVVVVVSLHLVAGRKESRSDLRQLAPASEGYLLACDIDRIPDDRAVVVPINGERVAIFRYEGKVSAVSNVCRHQNGPLGEGKIVDGCITCPWHGYQYRPADGCSPPPFNDQVATFHTRIVNGQVWILPTPNPPGTYVEPALISKVTP
jgi:methionine sulfoxide reductase heme-binding subunit